MGHLQAAFDRLGRLPVAIIGGGVAGLYTGWRLRQAQPNQTVALFEQSERTGGRLLTWLPFGRQAGLRAELGGMRFYAQQELVWNLIRHLGLPMVDFPVDGPNLIWYLRGYRMKEGDADAAGLHYALNQQERGKQPGELLSLVIDTVLGTSANRAFLQDRLGKPRPETRAEWDRVKRGLTYKGEPLWYFGFWNILADVLSYEGYRYISDALGYYSLTSNWNAAEALEMMSLEFAQEPVYKTLEDGFEYLPTTLRQRYLALGGQLFDRCSFRRFDRRPSGAFDLVFQDETGEEAGLIADRLILAMPRRALELLQPTRTFNPQSPVLKPLLETVSPYPAFKLFLLYAQRWWERTRGIVKGRSVTDLPIRQTYYFRPDRSPDWHCPDPPFGLLMATYDDAWVVDYWHGMGVPVAAQTATSEAFRRQLARLPVEFGGSTGATLPPMEMLQQAPPGMLARAKEQLALLHGLNVSDVPEPILGAYADWTNDPYGGGWNFWKPQVDVQEAMTRVRQPLGQAVPVYIVGEAYSGMQGWVEGALTTAELVLQRHFFLDRPGWLPAGYYLGW